MQKAVFLLLLLMKFLSFFTNKNVFASHFLKVPQKDLFYMEPKFKKQPTQKVLTDKLVHQSWVWDIYRYFWHQSHNSRCRRPDTEDFSLRLRLQLASTTCRISHYKHTNGNKCHHTLFIGTITGHSDSSTQLLKLTTDESVWTRAGCVLSHVTCAGEPPHNRL